MNKPLLALFLLIGITVQAQVGIGTLVPNASAQLDIVGNDKGVLITRVTLKSTTDNTTITNGNVESLLVYNTATTADVYPGYYYWSNGKWQRILSLNDIQSTIKGLNTTNESLTTDGTNLILTDSDNNYVSIPLASLFSETITSLKDNGNGSITYTDEKGNKTTVDVAQIITNNTKVTTLVKNTGGTYTYTSEDGTKTTVDVPADILIEIQDNTSDVYQEIVSMVKANETLTSLKYDAAKNALSYKDEDGTLNTLDLNEGAVSYDAKTNKITYTDAAGAETVLTLNNTSLTYKTTTQELTYVDSKGNETTIGLGSMVKANETLTTFKQDADTGQITYTDEAGNDHAAEVVSTDTDNLISVGTDGGAFLGAAAVQGQQKTATLVNGTNTTVTSSNNPAGSNNTEYKVNVATAQSTTLGVVKEAATDPTVNINTNGELAVNSTNTKLKGDVTGSLDEAKVEAIQGIAVSDVDPTDGQALVYNATDSQWAPGTIDIKVADLKDARNLTGNGITVNAPSGNGTGAVLKDVELGIANGAITAEKLNQMGAGKNDILRWDGTEWTVSKDSIGWKLNGNTVSSTAFIGTLNDEALRFKQNKTSAGFIDGDQTAYGINTLKSNTKGENNTAIGFSALTANTTGSENTALGWNALVANTTGNNNTAIGRDALEGNDTGDHNTAVGDAALDQMVSGSYNTGIGDGVDITTGSDFATALGYNSKAGSAEATALGARSEANGKNATAIGYRAIVEQDNSLVLGSISGKNSATANTKVGIGTTKPTERLDIGNGKVRVRDLPTTAGAVTDRVVVVDSDGVLKSVAYLATRSIKTIDTDYTALASDVILLGDAQASSITITLPDPTTHKGKKYTIKKQNNGEANYVKVKGNFVGSLAEIYNALPYSGWDLVSNGTEWIIINKF